MHYPSFDSYDSPIRRLETDLYRARRTIIELMPERIRELLDSFYGCDSREASYRWQHEVVEELIGLAEAIPDKSPFRADRAYCPLCGSGSSSPYERGFSLPEGLRRHLSGWGNAQQCDVMDAVMAIARNTWDDRFQAAEYEEEERDRQLIAERKRTELLYRVAADSQAELIDEGLYGGKARSREEIAWAEERLATLGFTTTRDGNVVSYTDERADFVVFADPRASGQIRFLAFKKPLPKRPRRTGLRKGLLGSFIVMDSWKKDIKAKYERRVVEACQR